MPWLRKSTGGATVLGYTWRNDGDIVQVSYEHAVILLRIPDGGYSEVDPPTTFSAVVHDTPVVGRTPVRGRKPTRR